MEIAEIRIPVATSSLAGYAAAKQRILNIKDVYDDDELKAIDADLKFDKSWDKKTGFTTKQVLVFPIIFKKFMLGVIQLLNRKDGSIFSKLDEWAVEEMSKILGIALFNQKRMAKTRANKFTYLLENQVITQKELDKAIADARETKPFGLLTGQPITDSNLFHLAPLVCLKFRGLDWISQLGRCHPQDDHQPCAHFQAARRFVCHRVPGGCDHHRP